MNRQFYTYVLVGLVSALVDIGLMQLANKIGVHYLLSATFGFVSGLVLNFILHTRLTFGAKYSYGNATRYLFVVFVNYLLTLFLVLLFQSWFLMALLGKVVSLPLVAVNGFLLSKYWIYK